MNLDALFQPFDVKSLHLKNRVVMAPMTRGKAPDGIPGADNIAYYRRRAEGEVSLILTEGTVINRPGSRNMDGVPYFYGDAALDGWKHVVHAVHSAGGKIGPQIWHGGAVAGMDGTYWGDAPQESPSGLLTASQPIGETMSEEAIADSIAAFASAAGDAKRLGFDLVELHGAHGYLIDQFFWADTNRRSDRYGGLTIRERNRFAVEVIKAVREEVGEDYPIVMRLSQWKVQDYSALMAPTPHALADWVQPLVEAGVDMLHCSQRRFWEPEFPDVDGPEGLNFAGWTKKLTGVPTVTVGSVGLDNDVLNTFSGEASKPASLANLVNRLEKGEFDLVTVGRALLSNPDWVTKVRNGHEAELKPFNAADLAIYA